jgi:hypothetical protein
MNIFMKALYQGYQLPNVEAWKKSGLLLTVVSALTSAAVGFAVSKGWMPPIPEETVMEISSALVSVISMFLSYLMVATTEKIGLRKPEPNGEE